SSGNTLIAKMKCVSSLKAKASFGFTKKNRTRKSSPSCASKATSFLSRPTQSTGSTPASLRRGGRFVSSPTKQAGSLTIRILESTSDIAGSRRMVRYVLMDIEGTLISVAFVREILFPFAKHRLAPFLQQRRHDPRVVQWTVICQDTIEHETGTRPPYEELPVLLTTWIDQDRKLAGLKGLQGMIWDEGYRQGVFEPELYGDVLPTLTIWQARGIRLGIYSSGSEQAQRLLFAHTNIGDVTS